MAEKIQEIMKEISEAAQQLNEEDIQKIRGVIAGVALARKSENDEKEPE